MLLLSKLADRSIAAKKVLPYVFGDRASFTVAPNQRGLVVLATPEAQKTVEALLKVLDGDPQEAAQTSFTVPTNGPKSNPTSKEYEIRLFRLQHLTLDQAAETISKLFPWGSGVVFTKVPSHRALMASGTADLMQKIEALIKELDVPAAAATADNDDEAPADPPAVVGEARGPMQRPGQSGFGGGGGRGLGGPGRGMGAEVPPEAVREVKVFRLQTLAPAEAMMVLSELFEVSTTFSSVPEQRTIIANGPADALRRIEALLSALDASPASEPGQSQTIQLTPASDANPPDVSNPDGMTSAIKLFHLQHMDPVHAVSALSPLFPGDKSRGSSRLGLSAKFVALPSRRVVIVRGTADDLKKIEALLSTLDMPETTAEIVASAVTSPSGAAAAQSSDESKVIAMQLSHRDPDAVMFSLKRLLPSGGFNAQGDFKTNSITVTGPPSTLEYVKVMIQLLDVPIESRPDGSARSITGRSVADSPEVGKLRKDYAQHDARVRSQAERARDPFGHMDGRAPRDREQQLRDAVSEAFDARQKLQQAELEALELRIKSMRRNLSTREKIKDAIVKRRVEELLNPALEWETSANGKPPADTAAAGTAATVTTDWPIPFKATRGAVTPSIADTDSAADQTGQTERVYRGKSQNEWQALFAAETDPAAKLVAALALVSLAAPLPPDENIEQILDVGEEIVRSSYGDRALEIAFDYTVPPQRPAFAASTDWKNTYIQFDNELTSRLSALPPETLARHIAEALTTGSDARAAFAYSLLKTKTHGIYADKAAIQALFNQADAHRDDVDRAALCLLARLSVHGALRESKAEELSPRVIELASLLRQPDNADNPINRQVREALLTISPPPAYSPEVSRALADLAVYSIARDRQLGYSNQVSQWMHASKLNHSSPYLSKKVDRLRKAIGPSLAGFVDAGNAYFEQHSAAPYTPEDRAVAHELAVVLPLYSDGDDWPVDKTAEILTAQLRAAYTDDPTQTVDQPLDELLPAKPWAHLAQIFAITGEIPEFIGTATPKSKAVAEKLATLDRLLAGKVAKDRIENERLSLNGLFAEAPVETISRLVADGLDTGPVGLTGETWSLEFLLDASSFLNPDAEVQSGFHGRGGFVGPDVARTKETIDPLLLLAILNDLTGTDEAQDRRIESLFQAWVKNGQLGDHIKILLDSPLQSRRHAARMLRAMAAKTKNPELRERIQTIDPTAVELNPNTLGR